MTTKFAPTVQNPRIFDASEHSRPEMVYNNKLESEFRRFSEDPDDPIQERVRKTYFNMHTYQTVDFVRSQMENWLQFNKCKMTVKEALLKLNELVDESDPDSDLPNIVHAFQTAEKIREEHPNDDWFHLTGLVHDLGKIMAFYGLPQWAVVGDTFPVGCEWGNTIAYRETSFDENPDGKDPRYNTKYGMYKPNCGIENLTMSWGHDEYFYRVLKHNKSTLPEIALAMIRFHSFYPWHGGGDYKHFCTPKDEGTLRWVLEFNKYDLYTKSSDLPDIDKLWPYYEQLIEKYIPGVLEW